MRVHHVSITPFSAPICLTNVPVIPTPEDMKNSKRGEVLTARVAFRATESELAAWKAAADAADMTFSGWAAEILNEAVEPQGMKSNSELK